MKIAITGGIGSGKSYVWDVYKRQLLYPPRPSLRWGTGETGHRLYPHLPRMDRKRKMCIRDNIGIQKDGDRQPSASCSEGKRGGCRAWGFFEVRGIGTEAWRSPVSYTHLDVYKRQLSVSLLVIGKEAITIKPIQSFFGSKPKKAIFILRYAYNIIAR